MSGEDESELVGRSRERDEGGMKGRSIFLHCIFLFRQG